MKQAVLPIQYEQEWGGLTASLSGLVTYLELICGFAVMK